MQTASKSRVLSISQKLYQVSLFAYPAEHRREYGPLMAQLFRDLCRDTYQRSGFLGLVHVWIRTLWDLAKTAAGEHIDMLTGASLPGTPNRPVVPVLWHQVGLAILPGLLVIGSWSGFFDDVLGRRASQVLDPNGLLVLCTLLVIVGLVLERKLTVWSFSALGILFFSLWWLTLPIAAFGVYRIYKQKGLHIPHSGKVLFCSLGLVSAADFIYLVFSDHNPDRLAAIVAGLFFLILWLSLLLLPFAIGLTMTHRHGLFAGIFIAAAEFIPFSELFDPSYALGLWTSNQALVTAAATIPAAGFLVVTPIWIMRSRSTRGQVQGLLIPTSIAIASAEAISAAIRPYYTEIWPLRITGIAYFLAALTLAAILYAINQGGSPIPNQTPTHS